MQYLTVQIKLTEKNKSNYCFPPIVKNNGKKRLETFESEKGKVVSSNFLKRFNWEKARKNKNESIVFEKQIRILS